MAATAGDPDAQTLGIVRLQTALEHGIEQAQTQVLQEALDERAVGNRVWCILCGQVLHRTRSKSHQSRHSREFDVGSDPNGLQKLQAEVTRKYGKPPELLKAVCACKS